MPRPIKFIPPIQTTIANVLTPIPVSVSMDPATMGQIDHVDMPLAATEYSYTFPTGTKQFEVKTRTAGKLQLCFSAGQTTTEFFTVPSGASLSESGLKTAAGLTLYFQCSTPNNVLEIKHWI